MYAKILLTISVFMGLVVLVTLFPTWVAAVGIVLSVVFIPQAYLGVFGAALFHDVLFLADGAYALETILRSGLLWFVVGLLVSWLLHRHTKFSKIEIK